MVRLSLFLLGLLPLSVASFGETPAITLAGSSTVARVLLPLKAGVEAAQKVEIRLQPNGSGRGLSDLVAGRADAAMLSGPVDYLLERVNAQAQSDLRSDQLEKLKLAASPKAELVALVHPSNPIRALTADQMRRILTGELADWSQVGGPDHPIILILPDELDGVRATAATTLVQGQEFTPNARHVERTAETIPLVLAEAGAIALLPRGTLAANATWAEIQPTPSLSLYIVARRDRLEADPKLEVVLNSLQSRALSWDTSVQPSQSRHGRPLTRTGGRVDHYIPETPKARRRWAAELWVPRRIDRGGSADFAAPATDAGEGERGGAEERGVG